MKQGVPTEPRVFARFLARIEALADTLWKLLDSELYISSSCSTVILIFSICFKTRLDLSSESTSGFLSALEGTS